MKGGVFYEQKNISASVIAGIFRSRVLTTLLEQGVIKQELINMLMCWNHRSGFNVHVRGQIAGADGKAIESIARYMSRAAISVDRVKFNPEDNTRQASNLHHYGIYGTARSSYPSILKYIGEETVRPPPLRVKTPTANIPDTVFWDSSPSVEAYFHDPEYVN